jgi:energy-coupling factor transport system ATP-binding protein
VDLLEVEDLTFTYPQCAAPAVRNVSFRAEKGSFSVLCGATGSGKSTLLRLLKRELVPLGEKSGRVLIRGEDIDETEEGISARSVGFVMQNPEQQIVTDKVWHELAFGLENLNTPPDEIARRVAEMAGYFGIESWYEKSVSELSGGQKQLLNLASVMVMDPELLILDEPTTQLDPIAASDFIATLKKLNADLSLTVLVAEHRLEELIPACDRLLVMEDGMLIGNGAPREVIRDLGGREELMLAMPAASRLYRSLGMDGRCPLTVREGRQMIEEDYENRIRSLPEKNAPAAGEPALEFRDVWFRYERDLPDVLRGLNFTVSRNEIFCILGGNGSGKTTSLGCAAAVLKPYAGQIRVFGKKLREYKNQSLYRDCLALLPQDVQTVFLRNTVREELEDAGAVISDLPFDPLPLYDKHPYDCSGGEQQLVALAKALATKPKLLLMDEPTKGLDAGKKRDVAGILRRLKESGVTVVVVTHDVEFAAVCADRCAMFFRGGVVSVGRPDAFFSGNSFYTTAAARMSKGFYDRAVTVEDLSALCRLNGRKGGGGKC